MSLKNGFENMVKKDFSEQTNPDKPSVDYGDVILGLECLIGVNEMVQDPQFESEDVRQAITAIETLQAENERLREALEDVYNDSDLRLSDTTFEALEAVLKGESDE